MVTTDEVKFAWTDGYNANGQEFDEWLRNVQADAWDLGFIEGSSPDSDYVTFVEDADNPYRGNDE